VLPSNVEQVGERAGEDALDARDLVAGLAQVAQGLDHRQAGADRGLVEVARAAAARAPRAARGSAASGPAVGLLVRRDDVDAGRQPLAG
jgi:hypothetical protein